MSKSHFEVEIFLLVGLIIGFCYALYKFVVQDPYKGYDGDASEIGSTELPLSFSLFYFSIKQIWKGLKGLFGVFVAIFIISSLVGLGLGIISWCFYYVFKSFF